MRVLQNLQHFCRNYWVTMSDRFKRIMKQHVFSFLRNFGMLITRHFCILKSLQILLQNKSFPVLFSFIILHANLWIMNCFDRSTRMLQVYQSRPFLATGGIGCIATHTTSQYHLLILNIAGVEQYHTFNPISPNHS